MTLPPQTSTVPTLTVGKTSLLRTMVMLYNMTGPEILCHITMVRPIPSHGRKAEDLQQQLRAPIRFHLHTMRVEYVHPKL